MRSLLLMIFSIALALQPQMRAQETPSDSSALPDTLNQTYEIVPLYDKSPAAINLLQGKEDSFGLWIDDKEWIKASLGLNKESVFEFEHISGEIQAILLFGDETISTDALKEIAFTNARRVAPDAHIVFAENRIVNGKEMLCMRIDGSISYVPFTYYGYYYAGPIGTLQLIAILSPDMFEEYLFDLDNFLSGLEVFK